MPTISIEDRRKGALYGQAIGDALGVPWEFNEDVPDVEYLDYGDTRIAESWEFGEVPKDIKTTEGFGDWSDDTEQALCILEALASKEITTLALAASLKDWYDRDGKGCGTLTSKVLTHPNFLKLPLEVSESLWNQSGKTSAPNGGVMRTSAVAIYKPWDLKWVVENAVQCCKVTHYDPRCAASCVAVSVALALLIRGDSIPHAIDFACKAGQHIEPGCKPFIHTPTQLSKLDLDSGGIGYTYKCMAAGFWALKEFQRCDDEGYEDIWSSRITWILTKIIKAGGDTDTNAAVAGALLGAVCGFKNLPENLVTNLSNIEKLEQYYKKLPKSVQEI